MNSSEQNHFYEIGQGKNNLLWKQHILAILAFSFSLCVSCLPFLFLLGLAEYDGNPQTQIDLSKAATSGHPLSCLAESANSFLCTDWFYLLIIGLHFTILSLGVIASIRYIYQRPVKSLFTSTSHFRWDILWIALAFWVGLQIIGTSLMSFLIPGSVQLAAHFDLAFWLSVGASLLIIPFQAGTEELIFRGYMGQILADILRVEWLLLIIITFLAVWFCSFEHLHIAGFTDQWWAPLVLAVSSFYLLQKMSRGLQIVTISSLAFGLLHYYNPEINHEHGFINIVSTAIVYIAMGFLAGLLVLREQGLESALGLHIGNNLFATTLVSYNNSALQTKTLFFTPAHEPFLDLVWLIVSSILFYFLLPPLGRLFASPNPR